MQPEPRGRPSSAATAKWESQGTRRILLFLVNDTIKFPAAPESINGTISITFPLISRVTAISKLVADLEITLTAAGLRDGRVGQDARRCPGNPQYKHNLCQMRLSLSPPRWCVKPICMGSTSELAAEGTPLNAGRRLGRRKRRRLSILMDSSMNYSSDFPSPRQASSDCSSVFKLLRLWSLSVSSGHPIWAARVRNELLTRLLSSSRVLEHLLETLNKRPERRKGWSILAPHRGGPNQRSPREKRTHECNAALDLALHVQLY